MNEPTYKELEQRVKELEKEAVERKEDALNDSTGQTTFDAINDAVCLLDLKCNILMCDRAMSHLVKKSPQEITGRKCWEVMHGTSKPIEGCPIVRMQKTLSRETMLLPIRDRWFNVVVAPLLDDAGNLAGAVHIISDITQLKQSEKALRATEERVGAMLSSIGDHMSMMDKDLTIIWANETAKKLFGNDIIGKKCFEAYHQRKEPCEPYPCLTMKAFQDGKAHEHEIQVTDKNGEIIYFHCTANVALRDKEGNPIAAIEISRDITDSKRAQEALRLSEARLRAVVDSLPFDFFIMDENNRYVMQSSGSKEAWSDITGKRLEDLVTDKSTLALWQDNNRRAFAGEVVKGEVEFKTPEKSGFFYNIISPIREGESIRGVLGVNIDITDLKKAEEALKNSEVEKRAILDTTMELMVYHDTSLKIIWANRAAGESVGLTTEQLVGRYCHEIWCRQSEPIADCPAVKVIETGQPHEVEFSHAGRFWIHKGYPVHNNKGGIEGVVTTALDITDYKQAEEKRKKLEAQLQKVEKMEAIGTLAGGIAHDFNNLLMGIQGHASLTLMHIDSGHPHFEHLRGIEDMVQRGANLTKQLLGFARRGKYEIKPTDLNEVIDNSSEMFGRTKKEIRIHRKYQKHIWTVEIDKGQIEQVLLNLYVNAWQAMSRGGNLYIETSNVVIDDTSATAFGVKPGKFVLLTVTDTGTGMDKKTMERIFNPFYTTKPMGQGTGLGLASAYGIVKSHAGHIEAASEQGQGATFSIYLPASEKKVEKIVETVGEFIKGTETVLIVDDEEIILEVGRELLEGMGYQVFTAINGAQAIKFYRDNQDKIDIVLLDMIMPDMDGGEVYDRVKEINPDIKVLLCSGYSIDGQATEILKLGCDGFIQKPFN
ncbi:MAG: PAS domain-containing protein, partial [Desulfobulbaceae bacterium]|nr:PAS domain-containing protein [Desulfobulbaceae bacterium]